MSSPPSSPPSAKRIKLEDDIKLEENDLRIRDVELKEKGENEVASDVVIDGDDDVEAEDDGENNCSICLHSLVDRTVIPKCSHEFCFECLLVWTEQSRRCPLCSQAIEDYVIHSIRSRYDYRKHYLPPLRTSPPPSRPAQSNAVLQNTRNNARRRRREREWGTRGGENEENDKLERSIAKRRWIYRHDLYAKHVASNAFTKYRPYPTPAQFSASQDLISRTTTFLRRELQVWEALDIEFLTTLIISLMKAIDIRSESAVKLIAEFLDMDAPYTPGGRHVNAEHFAHEVYCYVRSPYKDLFVYDTVVQYEAPPGASPPPDLDQSRRWRTSSLSQVPTERLRAQQDETARRVRSRSRSSERSGSWSPSGRKYSPTRDSGIWDLPDGQHSRHRLNTSGRRHKGYQHHSNDRRDEILRTDKRKSSYDESKVASSSRMRVTPSSSTEIAEHLPVYAVKGDMKGKRQVSRMELTDSLAEGGVPEFTAGAENLNADCTPPAVRGKHLRNDAHEMLDQQDASGRPSSSKVLRPPRNKSLLDSVKAHLAGNSISSSVLASETAKRAQIHRAQVQVVSAGEQEEVIDDHPKNTKLQLTSRRPSDYVTGVSSQLNIDKNTGVLGSQSTSVVEDGSTSIENPHFFHGSRFSNSCFQGASQQGLEPGPKINGTQSGPSRLVGQAQVISATNNTLDVTISTFTHLSSSISSPPADSIHIQHCAVGPGAAILAAGGDSNNAPVQQHPHSLDVNPSSFPLISQPLSSGSELAPLPISDGPHMARTFPSHANCPIERGSHTKSTSITFDDRSQQSPHAKPLKSSDVHTRLLARLELEKTQAHAWAHSDTGFKLPSDSEAHALRDAEASSSCYSGSSPIKGDASNKGGGVQSDLAFDREGGTRTSPNTQRHAHIDPDSGSESVSEEARVREAKLKQRAQLRVRLAAEKRLADGDE